MTARPENKCVKRVRDLNPGFTVRVYDAAGARQFVHTHCKIAARAYDTVVPVSFKADVFRYCALWSHGGIYIDDDMYINTTFQQFAEFATNIVLFQDAFVLHRFPEVVWPYEYRSGAMNGFIVVRDKHNELLECALATSIRRILDRAKVHKLALTGPRVLGECVRPHTNAMFVGYMDHFWNRTQWSKRITVPRAPTPHYSLMSASDWFSH